LPLTSPPHDGFLTGRIYNLLLDFGIWILLESGDVMVNGVRTSLRSLVLLVTLLALSAWAPTQLRALRDAPHSPTDSLYQRITALRSQAEHLAGLELARQLIDTLRSDPNTQAWQIDDAERLAATLELAASLPEEEQRELAAADGATARIDSHYIRGEFDQAAALAERQLVTRRRLLGDEQTDVAASLVSLASVLHKLGDFAEGEARAREALAIYRKIVGEFHPDVASCLNILGLNLMLQGRFDEAERLFRQALDMNRDLFGARHQAIVDCLGNIGAVRQQQRDFFGAEPFFRAALVPRPRLRASRAGRLRPFRGALPRRPGPASRAPR
jgi:tetratricopeptide (TPR) repeat protein